MLIYANKAREHVAKFYKIDEEEYRKLQDRISEVITSEAKNGKTSALIILKLEYNAFREIIINELRDAGYTVSVATIRTPNGESILNIRWD